MRKALVEGEKLKIEPFYCDMHIHTSLDANNYIDANYDIEALASRVADFARGHTAMISLTDHNVINKAAYEAALRLEHPNLVLVLGVELHVKSNGPKPYHAHAYFSIDPSDQGKIDEINQLLDELYPNKLPSKNETIPTLPEILNKLRHYEFLFLPHGGQSHSTFDNSVEEGELFDDVMMRNVYYNTFDGFTARSNSNIEATAKYFERIGISEFTGLITGSDNYDPKVYPQPKSEVAERFTPTWIYSEASFDGLRMALSEKGRIVYSQTPPNCTMASNPSIERIILNGENIDIDVELSPGLNVVIGSSSTGKTLFLEAIARNAGILDITEKHSFYDKFGIADIALDRNDNQSPYYINQSYIGKVVDKSVDHDTIEDIQILKDVFPQDRDAFDALDTNFNMVREQVSSLFSAAESVQTAEQALRRLSVPSDLIPDDSLGSNPISLMLPNADVKARLAWKSSVEKKANEALAKLEDAFNDNPLLPSITKEVDALKERISEGRSIATIEESIRSILVGNEGAYSDAEDAARVVDAKKKADFASVLENVVRLRKGLLAFDEIKQKLLNQEFEDVPKTIKLAGHTLSVVYSFKMSPEKLLEAINQLLNTDYKLQNIEELSAERLAASIKGIDGRRNIPTLDRMAQAVSNCLEKSKIRRFSILTKDKKDWNNLSEGRKTAVLLDLILGYKGNTAPLLIDQPEDNLAADYINSGLTDAIKGSKSTRQTIVVTHNATIPMLADAQTVVLCRSVNGKLVIRSSPLEGKIEGKRVLDWIVEITDGGEPSVQKRFRKYNFKRFEGR